ncbi:MAG: futalosine hydrolase [Bacteroidota bacterium]
MQLPSISFLSCIISGVPLGSACHRGSTQYTTFAFYKFSSFMNYLLIAATTKEIEPFLSYIKQASGKKINLPDVLVTGIGLTATTYHLTKQLRLKKYDLVIQAGVAGCFNKKLSLGSVVVVAKDAIADQSVIELKQLKTLFDLKLVPADQFPYTKTWLVNPYSDWLKKTKLKRVKGISVNEITTSKQKIAFYEESFNAVTESMEGAALHYTCLMENVPFLQMRSMSNYIGERNKKKWNMKESIINLNTELIQLVENL